MLPKLKSLLLAITWYAHVTGPTWLAPSGIQTGVSGGRTNKDVRPQPLVAGTGTPLEARGFRFTLTALTGLNLLWFHKVSLFILEQNSNQPI